MLDVQCEKVALRHRQRWPRSTTSSYWYAIRWNSTRRFQSTNHSTEQKQMIVTDTGAEATRSQNVMLRLVGHGCGELIVDRSRSGAARDAVRCSRS